MSIMQTLISQQGPLPITVQFTPLGEGNVTFFLSGSGWSMADGSLAIVLLLDGQEIAVSNGFTNEGSSHKTLVPILAPATLTYNSTDNNVHTVTLEAAGATITDLNDNFNVSILY